MKTKKVILLPLLAMLFSVLFFSGCAPREEQPVLAGGDSSYDITYIQQEIDKGGADEKMIEERMEQNPGGNESKA